MFNIFFDFFSFNRQQIMLIEPAILLIWSNIKITTQIGMEVTVDDQVHRLGEYALEYLLLLIKSFDPSKEGIFRENVR